MDGQETGDHNNGECFQQLFVSVALNLKVSRSIENSNEKLKTLCSNKIPDITVFTIPEVSKETVEKFLKHIDVSKATGCDNIGPCLLKVSPFIYC